MSLETTCLKRLAAAFQGRPREDRAASREKSNARSLLRTNRTRSGGAEDRHAADTCFEWLRHGVELALLSVYELSADVWRQALEDSQDILSEPGVRHLIAARYPLQQIADAHEAVESGKMIGNILIDTG